MTLLINMILYSYYAESIMLMKYPLRQTTLALRSPQGGVRPGRWRLDGRGYFIYNAMIAFDKNARIHEL